MQLKSLEIFMSVLEHGSFSHAAQYLHTVQSNITSHIKKLESELGCELLSRQSPIQATSAGQDLAHYAQQILQLHRQAKEHFLHEELSKDFPLKIGSMETAAAVRLPALFHAILQKYPDLPLDLHTGSTRGLIDLVQSNQLDCAFIGNTEPIPNMFNLHMWTEKMLLVSAKKMNLQMDASFLENIRFIAFKHGCSYRRVIEVFLQGYQLPASQVIEMGSLDGIMNCVALGMGAAILPETYVMGSQYKDQLQFNELSPDLACSKTYLIANQPATWSRNLKVLLRFTEHFLQTLENENAVKNIY